MEVNHRVASPVTANRVAPIPWSSAIYIGPRAPKFRTFLGWQKSDLAGVMLVAPQTRTKEDLKWFSQWDGG